MNGRDEVKRVFHELCELPAERRSVLLESKPLSPVERAEVRRLLEQHACAGGVLSRPASESFARLVAGLGTGFDEYVIEREIERGGMGIVYLAHDTELDRPVALKTIRPEFLHSEHAVGRFRQEARAAAKLAHEHIVRVYRCGCDAGVHYIAMEYIDGVPLKRYIAPTAHPPGSNPPRPHQAGRAGESDPDMPGERPSKAKIRTIVTLIAEVADALAYAHERGVIHRDVKPSNILVDSEGRAKLTDFGIAKLVSADTLTASTDRVGSAPYMSPEQAAVERVPLDHRADIFSLGVVLYELLTGRRPFTGDGAHQILHAVRASVPIPVRTLNPDVPPDLAVVCEKMLEKRPHNRYPTAAHVAAELRCILRGDPIVARPPTAWRRLERRLWKHRAQVGAASVLVLVAALIGTLLLARHQWAIARVPVVVTSEPSGAGVYLQPYDGAGGAYASPVRLGVTPFRTRVLPGEYRITVAADAERFAEYDRYLRLGDSLTLNATPRALEREPEGKVLVPGRTHTLGWAGGKGLEAQRRVGLHAFWIDEHEVSNAEYAAFVRAGGTPPAIWQHLTEAPRLMNDPVVGLTLEQMQAYAEWRGERLPTSDEWEAAARYPDARPLPWTGDDLPDELPLPKVEDLLLEKHWTEEAERELYVKLAAPVESAASLRTPLGLSHMATNVHEATGTRDPSILGAYVVKGSWFNDDPRYWDLSRVLTQPEGEPSYRIGFRCARSATLFPLGDAP